MSLGKEWSDRLKLWKNELKNHIYEPIGEIEFSGFETLEQLAFTDAAKLPVKQWKNGDEFGSPFGLAWFFSSITIPENVKDCQICLDINAGGEGLLYVNGKEFGTRRADWIRYRHQYSVDLEITRKSVPGERFDIAFECYAGHGPREYMTGPITDNADFLKKKKYVQPTVGVSTYGIWNEQIYQLLLEINILIDLRNTLDPDSMRVMEIDNALKQFTLLVDYENGSDRMNSSIADARAMIEPLLTCHNGSTSPVMYMFGHSHLDIAWLWPIEETVRKCARTFSTQLHLMERYGDYKFLQSQPYLYERTREIYPDLYKRIKEMVSRGQWLPEGGMYVEADTNMPSGESLVRQFLYGKEFFISEFGVNSELLWLPDVFGYSASLPQIMRKSGVRYFSTQKILFAYNDGERFPHNYFSWTGIDGSRVTSFIHDDYGAATNAKSVISHYKKRISRDNLDSFLYPFGYGDGGAGPTRDHIENIHKQADLEGSPKCIIDSPIAFFEQLPKYAPAEYFGELYFSAHRGVLTSQAKTKRGNRKSEFILREAELWHTLLGNGTARAEIESLYKIMLLNQFHDILPGSSIAAVYERAELEYAYIDTRAKALLRETLESSQCPANAITVFNSLSWDRDILTEIPAEWNGARYTGGSVIAIQSIGNKRFANVNVTGMSSTVIERTDLAELIQVPAGSLRSESNDKTIILENELLKITINRYGELESVINKSTGFEYTKSPMNKFMMYADIPRIFDAWDIDSCYDLSPVVLDDIADINEIYEGPILCGIKYTRKLSNSVLTQTISLKSNCRAVEFKTEIEWNECHKLLKVDVPCNLNVSDMMNEIQYGYIVRPTYHSRQIDADRFEVTNHKWSAMFEADKGVAILNDCKYGISGRHSTMSLTLMKAAKAPDYSADAGHHEFSYMLFFADSPFASCEVVQKAYELNTPSVSVNGIRNVKSLIKASARNVIIDAIKEAQDGSGDLIIRIYECTNSSTAVFIKTGFSISNCFETDLCENNITSIPLTENTFATSISGFEVKTYRLVI